MTEPTTLYGIHGSHPCVTVEAGLRIKSLEYDKVDLPYGLAPFMQAVRFGKRTVPALTVGRQKVSGSRLILRALDGLAPDPPFMPAAPAHRTAVDRADLWGDEVFQEHVRWIAILGLLGEPSVAPDYGSRSLPPLPARAYGPATVALFNAEMRLLGHPPGRVRSEYLPALPGHLDHIDALIDEGVIGGETPNVADLQLAGSLRLLVTMGDLRGAIDARPCGRLARRLVPDYDGAMPRGVLESPL